MLNRHSNEIENAIEKAEIKILTKANMGKVYIRIQKPDVKLIYVKDSSPWDILEIALVGYSNNNRKENGKPTFNGKLDNTFSLYDLVNEINKHTRIIFGCNKYNTLLLQRELETFNTLLDVLSKIMICENIGIDVYNAYSSGEWGKGYDRVKRITDRYVGYVKTSLMDNFNEGKEIELILVGEEHGYEFEEEDLPVNARLTFSPYCYSGDLKPIK